MARENMLLECFFSGRSNFARFRLPEAGAGDKFPRDRYEARTLDWSVRFHVVPCVVEAVARHERRDLPVCPGGEQGGYRAYLGLADETRHEYGTVFHTETWLCR